MSVNWKKKSINYWGDENIHDYRNEIVFISKGDTDSRDTRWPGDKPTISKIEKELKISRMAYVKIEDNKHDSDRKFISVLTGRFIVKGALNLTDDGYKLFLNRKNAYSFASNSLRVNFLKNAVRVSHTGIVITTGDQFRRNYEESNSYWSSGRYCVDLMNLKNAKKVQPTALKNDVKPELTSAQKACRNQSNIMLNTLEKYIELEYEADETIAAQERPFYFRNFRAEVSKNAFKQYFRANIEDADYKRLLNLKPAFLQVQEDKESDVLQFSVENLEADKKNCEIILSSTSQLENDKVINSDQFTISASPTLKNVRIKVIESVKEQTSSNKWLAPLAAGCYTFDRNIPALMKELDEEPFLNNSQKDGIRKGSGTDDYTLILGPPGTGKTTVILQWVKYFVKQGKRILVTSQNNKAVDNVLERLAKEDDLECIRVGNESKVSQSIHDLLIDNYATNIQKKLLSRLDDSLKELQEDLKYVTDIKQVLPQYKKDAKEILDFKESIEKIKTKLQKSTSKLEINNETIAKLDNVISTLSRELSEIDIFLKDYNNASSIKKILSYVNKVLSIISKKLKMSKKERLYKKLSKTHEKNLPIIEDINNIKKDLNEHENKLTQMQDLAQQTLPRIRESMLIKQKDFSALYAFDKEYNKVLENLEKVLNLHQKIEARASKWKESINNRQQALYRTLLEMVDVVGATCIGINTNKEFSKIPFDVVIVDESGQIQLHNLIVPLSRAPKAILVGDHKQLPPIVNQEMVDELNENGYESMWMEKSWFELLWDKTPDDRKAMLDTQFRSPSIISNYISSAFYENKYFAGVGMDKKEPVLDFCKSTLVFIDTSNSKNNLETTRDLDGRLEVVGNQLETKIVETLVRNIVLEKPDIAKDNELGIIVPYANHVKQIQKALEAMVKRENLDMQNLSTRDMVASVDSYQGQERDIILFSFSRSNLKGTVGFLSDWRRLNVAMTRTKQQIIMIGNFNTLTKLARPGSKDEEFKIAMQKLKEHVRDKGQLIDADTFLNNYKGSNS